MFNADFTPVSIADSQKHVKNYELVSKFNGIEFGEASFSQVLHGIFVMASAFVANGAIDEDRICLAIRDYDSGEIALEVVCIPCRIDIDKAKADIENGLKWDYASMRTMRGLDDNGNVCRMASDGYGGFGAPSRTL